MPPEGAGAPEPRPEALAPVETVAPPAAEPAPAPAGGAPEAQKAPGETAAGALCGEAALVGAAVPAVAGEGACGIAAPVRITAAGGVGLDPPPTLDCSAARDLVTWLAEGVAPAFAARGETVAALTIADAYSCRNRNRAASGKLSEHARGRALDVSAFRLASGATVDVRSGWSSTDWGPVLHRVHDAACGPFATVLGPEANAFHVDHLHLDSAERRSGPWCE